MDTVLAAASILFGFLLTGFWWTVDREVRDFEPGQRHIRPGFLLILLALLVTAVIGVVIPMRSQVAGQADYVLLYRGVLIAVILVAGHMLADLVHYQITNVQKWSEWKPGERVWLILSVVACVALVIRWCWRWCLDLLS